MLSGKTRYIMVRIQACISYDASAYQEKILISIGTLKRTKDPLMLPAQVSGDFESVNLQS